MHAINSPGPECLYESISVSLQAVQLRPYVHLISLTFTDTNVSLITNITLQTLSQTI